MNREKFREIHDVLMKQLDVSRELSDEEILEVIDNLILNQAREECFSLKRKGGSPAGTVLFRAKTGCIAGTY